MSDIIQFPKTPLRVIAIVPIGHPNTLYPDWCEARFAGWPHDVDPPLVEGLGKDDLRVLERGTLNTMRDEYRAHCRGLPISVHPECERRAAA